MLILLLCSLFFIIYEDFKYRAIHWWWLVIIAFSGYWIGHISVNYIALNILFIAIQLLSVSLYFSLKHRKFLNITNDYLGLGDILFFISLTFYFTPLEFIHFHIYSLIFTLIASVLIKVCVKLQINTIPLAGWMAIFLCICLGIKELNHYNILVKWRLI